jgi:hypothetical protein
MSLPFIATADVEQRLSAADALEAALRPGLDPEADLPRGVLALGMLVTRTWRRCARYARSSGSTCWAAPAPAPADDAGDPVSRRPRRSSQDSALAP